MKRSETLTNIAAALCAAQSQLSNAVKGNINPAFRSKYADLAAYIDASREALASNGLALSQGVATEGVKVTVTSLLLHKSGEWLESDLSLQAMRPDPQGIGSAITYGRRYALAALLNMASEDDDGNQASQGNHHDSGAHRTVKETPPPATVKAPPSTNGTSAKIDEDKMNEAYNYVAQFSRTTFAKTLWNLYKLPTEKAQRFEILDRAARALDDFDRRLGTAMASKIIAQIFTDHQWSDTAPNPTAAKQIVDALQRATETGEVPRSVPIGAAADSETPPF